MTTACIAAAVVITILGLFAVIIERTNERDEARDELGRTNREHKADLADRDLRIAGLEELVAAARPGLRVVPTQRDGHEPPPVARAVEAERSVIHDDLAVETFMESIERWGVEAEGER